MKLLLLLLNSAALMTALFSGNIAKAQCDTPGTITVSNLTAYSTDLTWQPVTGSMGYQILLKPSSAGIPTKTEWNSAAMSITNKLVAAGLMVDNNYCAYVRTICNNNDTSDVNSVCFATPCDSIEPTITLDFNTSDPTKLILKWLPAVAPGGRYEYAYGRSETLPTNGNLTTADSVLIHGLHVNTRYCFFARYYCPNSKTYTKWAKSCVTVPVPSGIHNNLWQSELSIAPNPAANIITVSVQGIHSRHAVSITDITGRVLSTIYTDNATTIINTSSLNSGVYFVQLSGKEYNTIQKLLIVK